MSIESSVRKSVLVGVAVIFLQSCGASKSAITSQELASLISGNTVYGVDSKGQQFIQIFSYDGSLLSGPADSRDESGKWKPHELGQWKVVDGRLCNAYTKPAARDAGCDQFRRNRDGKYVYTTPNGGQGSFEKIVGGRAE